MLGEKDREIAEGAMGKLNDFLLKGRSCKSRVLCGWD